ncbi:MAG: CsgG/HfaB family protein [Candidatus Marinimicrobia bacterium]|jgi:TolB-like protein|nr:CsgG/HfaB family protein [Candidatus Neomarinimicrobiota bacterium]
MKQPLAILLLLFSFVSAQETIAVIEFEGLGISQTEAKALTNRLRDELVNTGKYTVIERGKMEEILKEQAFQQIGCTSDECAVEVGKLLSVEGIIIGSISNVGSVYSVSARIVSVESGEITKSAIYDYQGSIDDLLTIGMRYVSELLFSDVSTTSESVTEPEPPTSIATSSLQVPIELEESDSVTKTSSVDNSLISWWGLSLLIFYLISNNQFSI